MARSRQGCHAPPPSNSINTSLNLFSNIALSMPLSSLVIDLGFLSKWGSNADEPFLQSKFWHGKVIFDDKGFLTYSSTSRDGEESRWRIWVRSWERGDLRLFFCHERKCEKLLECERVRESVQVWQTCEVDREITGRGFGRHVKGKKKGMHKLNHQQTQICLGWTQPCHLWERWKERVWCF